MNYWLMKSEPSTYSIDHLKNDNTTSWDGVRNYQARNFMRDEMQVGDKVFFYHSNCDVPGITGTAEVVKASHPDVTQFNPESKYYDPKATPEKPRWFLVDIKFVKKLDQTTSLQQLREESALKDMLLLRKGNRLSITPLTKKQWDHILSMV